MDDTQPKVKQQPEGEENSSGKHLHHQHQHHLHHHNLQHLRHHHHLNFSNRLSPTSSLSPSLVLNGTTVLTGSPSLTSFSDGDPVFVPLPDLTAPPSVHGRPCGAVEVAAEFGRVGQRANDSVTGRAVGVGHQALVCALWGPNGAPHLQYHR